MKGDDKGLNKRMNYFLLYINYRISPGLIKDILCFFGDEKRNLERNFFIFITELLICLEAFPYRRSNKRIYISHI